ncbi:MAG: AMP-binding protein [Pseudomonadota bacterium]
MVGALGNGNGNADAGGVGGGYTGSLPPFAFNMARYVIGRAAAATPDAIALIVARDIDATDCEQWTYRALEDSMLRAGAVLRAHGLEPGDRLLIQLPNTSLYARAYFGAIAVGLIPIPASDQLTAIERDFLLADSGARALLTDRRDTAHPIADGITVLSPDALDSALARTSPAAYADTTSETPAYLVYTSGTTSKPKGVLHAHRAAWGRRPMYDGWYGLRPDDRILHAGAFNWTYTLGTGLTDPWAHGATALVYTGEKAPEVWPRLIKTLGASLFATVPGLYRQILARCAPDLADLPTLRHGLMAGEQPPADLVATWTEMTGRPIYEALGMSEISTYISTSPATPPRADMAGRAQPGRCVAILSPDGDTAMPLGPGEEGLLAVHRTDPGLMLKYWNRPDADAEVRRGDWFVGGDLAAMDTDGYIAHRGRADDVIKALGYRVSPMEIEAAVRAHPAVSDIACVGLPVKDGVTIVAAFVVPTNPSEPPSADALDAFARTQLAAYKCPRQWTMIEALPRTANGKLKRKALLG